MLAVGSNHFGFDSPLPGLLLTLARLKGEYTDALSAMTGGRTLTPERLTLAALSLAIALGGTLFRAWLVAVILDWLLSRRLGRRDPPAPMRDTSCAQLIGGRRLAQRLENLLLATGSDAAVTAVRGPEADVARAGSGVATGGRPAGAGIPVWRLELRGVVAGADLFAARTLLASHLNCPPGEMAPYLDPQQSPRVSPPLPQGQGRELETSQRRLGIQCELIPAAELIRGEDQP